MDGNRTHPGRLSSAPQTVLKTAGLASVIVRRRPLMIGFEIRQSVDVRRRSLPSAGSAVILAVIDTEISLAINRPLARLENHDRVR